MGRERVMKGAAPATLYPCPEQGAPPRIKGISISEMALKAVRGDGFAAEASTRNFTSCAIRAEILWFVMGSGYILFPEGSRLVTRSRPIGASDKRVGTQTGYRVFYVFKAHVFLLEYRRSYLHERRRDEAS